MILARDRKKRSALDGLVIGCYKIPMNNTRRSDDLPFINKFLVVRPCLSNEDTKLETIAGCGWIIVDKCQTKGDADDAIFIRRGDGVKYHIISVPVFGYT